MSDGLPAEMSDETLAILSGAGITAVVAIAMLILGLHLASAERRAAMVQGAADAATIRTLIAALQAEKGRADALDDELFGAAADPDPVGARERVLQRWTRARAGSDHAAISVPPTLPAEPPGSGSIQGAG